MIELHSTDMRDQSEVVAVRQVRMYFTNSSYYREKANFRHLITHEFRLSKVFKK